MSGNINVALFAAPFHAQHPCALSCNQPPRGQSDTFGVKTTTDGQQISPNDKLSTITQKYSPN